MGKLAVIQAIRNLAGDRASGGRVRQLCGMQAARLNAHGYSAHRLYCDYYAVERVRKMGLPAWRGLYHGDLANGMPPPRASIPRETADFIHGWMQRNQRSSKQGYRDFLDKHWRAGKPVPGVPMPGMVGTWMDWCRWKWPSREVGAVCPPEVPRGWTYENVMRPHLKPRRADMALARQGIAAALNEIAPIPGTRADMRPLEFVTFDDVKFDFRVNVDSVAKPVDLVGLVALDIGTAYALGFGLRPVLLREDGSGEKLKLRDMKAMIVRLLTQYGWPEYGMTMILENGTATVDEPFARALHEATGGGVKIAHASMLGGTPWIGGFADRAVGNSRAKGWLESFFNPMHNRLADIGGQTGRRYDVAPQDEHGRRKELALLCRAGNALTLAERLELRMPYLNLSEASREIGEAFTALNHRRDHDLEGFDELLQWRFADGDQWRVWVAEPPPVEAIDHVQTRTVNEQPEERLHRLVGGVNFLRLADHSVPALLGNQREVALDKGQVAFVHEGKQHLFTPYTSENLPTLALLAEHYGEGAKVLAYYDATDPARIYLTDGKGRWIGALARTDRFSRKDTASTAANIATKKRLINAVVARVNHRSPEVAEQREDDLTHNLEVLSRADAITLAPIPTGTEATAPDSHTQLARAAHAASGPARSAGV